MSLVSCYYPNVRSLARKKDEEIISGQSVAESRSKTMYQYVTGGALQMRTMNCLKGKVSHCLRNTLRVVLDFL